MGFALWIDSDCVWAQGTHEYKPMGAAVIARVTDLFRQQDFVSGRRALAADPDVPSWDCLLRWGT